MHTPIAALTANVLDAERRKCMDDFLTKPYTVIGLRAILQRCLPSEPIKIMQEKTVEKTKPAASEADGSFCIDMGRFNTMREALGEDFPELVSAVIESTSSMIAQLPQALDNAEIYEVERLVHSIKSASANVGAMQLSGLARRMEEWAHNGELDKVNSRLVELREEFSRAKNTLIRI